ncbi:uncharacterized protein BDV17DRAFT_293076 [Aspergillus undulatus]|uniref:uncharacterized protein n=1 Tax=Aspergillus undulatus TaxID=1810928 RepID=UPI003CCE4FF9
MEEVDDVTRSLAGPTICVSDLNNSEDIVRYIKSSITRSIYFRRASKALQSNILIWVDFMLKELLKKRDGGSMREALDEAPNGVSEMIRHVLTDISGSLKYSPECAEDLNGMLAWATFSPWPLRLKEMDAIIKWRSDTGDG